MPSCYRRVKQNGCYHEFLEAPASMNPASANPRRPRVPRWLILVLTYVVSIDSLAWALSGYDFSQIKPAILSVKWTRVLVAVLLEHLVYVVQGWRWRAMLGPIESIEVRDTVHAIFIGLFASNVLPLR